MQALVQSYKTGLDKEMNVVIGRFTLSMDYKRPSLNQSHLRRDESLW